MKQKLFILVVFALMLFCVLSGCEQNPAETEPSSVESAPAATSEPTPEPTPQLTATPEPTATPTPAPSGDFEALFEENPVDKLLAKDLSMAASYSTIYAAYKECQQNWEKVINMLYPAAFDFLDDQQMQALDESQANWEANLDNEIDKIQESASDDADASLAAAEKVMELYRDWASYLCQEYFNAKNELPDLEAILNAQPAG